MGRITIFVADGCSDSMRTVKAMKSLLIPYILINVTKYPEKRKDMMSLTKSVTTPQVFFNNQYVGGSKETIELLREWDETCNAGSCDMTASSARSWSSMSSSPVSMTSDQYRGNKDQFAYTSLHERFMKEVGELRDPDDERLAIPTKTVQAETRFQRVAAEEQCVKLPNTDTSTVLEMMEMLKDLIQHVDNTVGNCTYKRSFMGHKIIGVVRGVFDVSPKRALVFAEHLLQLGIFHSLQESSNAATFDIKHVYRLHCYDTPDVLNSYRIWSERTDPDCLRMLKGLSNQLQLIEMSISDVLGKKDLKKALELSEFTVFEEAVCELQGTDLRRMDDNTKTVRCLLFLFVVGATQLSLIAFLVPFRL
jgi:glutaredoxin